MTGHHPTPTPRWDDLTPGQRRILSAACWSGLCRVNLNSVADVAMLEATGLVEGAGNGFDVAPTPTGRRVWEDRHG